MPGMTTISPESIPRCARWNAEIRRRERLATMPKRIRILRADASYNGILSATYPVLTWTRDPEPRPVLDLLGGPLVVSCWESADDPLESSPPAADEVERPAFQRALEEHAQTVTGGSEPYVRGGFGWEFEDAFGEWQPHGPITPNAWLDELVAMHDGWLLTTEQALAGVEALRAEGAWPPQPAWAQAEDSALDRLRAAFEKRERIMSAGAIMEINDERGFGGWMDGTR